MRHQNMNLEIKAVESDGSFSGYGSVFDNIDSDGDVVRAGAFEQSLQSWRAKGRLPPMLWNHNSDEPIGLYTKMAEDARGLYVEGRLLIDDVPRAKATHALIKQKGIGGMSIGYRLKKYERDTDADTTDLLEIDLWEVSLVTFPANEAATFSSVKDALAAGSLPSLSEFEQFLRDAGFSKSQATAVASHGLRQMLRDAAAPMAKEIESALNILKGNKQ